MRRERRPSPLRGTLRGLLLLALGGLVGANAMYYAMTHDIGRRLGLAPVPQASAGDTRVETPLPLPTASAPAPTGDTANSAPTAPVAQAAASPIAAMPATTANLLLPVQGVAASQLQDTFTDSRSEGRSHDAIDIMAPAGTPVLAVADGTVEKLFDSKQGGLTLYQFNPERTLAWYYAHLQGYAPGIAERKALKRGEVIGYVGSTGNANPEAPHLHFAIFVLGPEKQWWKGEAINPYPQLGGKPR